MVERLLVASVDRHLRPELGGVVQGPDLDYNDWPLRSRYHVGAALGAELSRNRPLQILSNKLLGCTLVYLKASGDIDRNTFGEPPVMY
jgi:hypothetical protein